MERPIEIYTEEDLMTLGAEITEVSFYTNEGGRA